MTAYAHTAVECPECGAVIPLPVRIGRLERVGAELQAVCEPEAEDFWAHVWTHEFADDR